MIKVTLTKELLCVLILQLVALIAVLLDFPVLRQIVGFVYLSFFPGLFVLRLLRIGKISWIEAVLLSFGVSIAFVMLIGAALNEVLFGLGSSSPLSTSTIIVTSFVSTTIFCFASYFRNAEFMVAPQISLKFSRSRFVLFSISALMVLGTIFGSLYGSNIVLFVLILAISALVICSFSKKLIPNELHPLLVYVISFFLLFHVSLVSNYVIGYDVNLEMFFSKLTYNASFWDRTIPYTYNSMLSVTILPVVYSRFLNIDLNLFYKVVSPLIYSFVPVILYTSYRKLTSSRIAFFSVFLFMLMDTFYAAMIGLSRQMIAELFFALLVLLIANKTANPKSKILFLVFSSGLIVSHYALSYIFIFYLVFTLGVLFIFKRSTFRIRKTPRRQNDSGISCD